MVWSCFPFKRSDQNHLARHSERGKKTRRTKEEVGRQYQGMDMPGVRQVPEGSGEQGKMEKTGCKIICGAPTTLAVRGLLLLLMIPAEREALTITLINETRSLRHCFVREVGIESSMQLFVGDFIMSSRITFSVTGSN